MRASSSDPSDDMLTAAASPWIRAAGGLVLGAGVVALFVGLQTVVMGIHVPLFAKVLVSLVTLCGLLSFPCGFGVWQKRATMAAAAIGCAGALLLFSGAWAVLLLVNGNVSPLALLLVPLSAAALASSALAYGPVRRYSDAYAEWVAK